MARFGKASPAQPTAPSASAAATVTVVARETRFVGELTGSRAVRIEGSFQGTIDLQAPLEVSAGAQVEAEVHATSIRIGGAVVGNVTGTELVELLAGAVIKGDVTAQSLHMVEGAKLEGRVQMRTGDGAGQHLRAAPANTEKTK